MIYQTDMIGLVRTLTKAIRILQVFAAVLTLAACKVELNSGLGETEANEMLSKLIEHNIVASKRSDKDNTVTLLVDEAQFGEAVELLKRYGLPRPQYANMGDVFASDSLVSSPTQEWARFNYALRQELSKTISTLPGIVTAEVHIANPRKDMPFDNPPPPSASVLVLIAKDAVTDDLIPQIKQLVAFSVESVEYERVGVIVSPVASPTRPTIELVDLGGIILHKNSFERAVVFIAGIGFLTALSAAAATIFVIRHRTRKAKETV
jgi:type III secretion protein J